MLKRFLKRINLNFRRSNSDRKSLLSYRNYHQRIRQVFQRVNILPKFKNRFKNEAPEQNGFRKKGL